MSSTEAPQELDTNIESLGHPKIDSPFNVGRFIADDARILFHTSVDELEKHIAAGTEPPTLVKAGPRSKIFFDPSKLRCAVVTCGGLCPGLNDVIRSVVLTLYYTYGVRQVYGIRYGLQGFIAKYRHPVVELGPDDVTEINQLGGTILGSSRGPQEVDQIVDALERLNIGILFMIGGDGTFRAAERISGEIRARGLKISVIGIPKTIDNDIKFVERSFGFQTAVREAAKAIDSAHVEALGAPNGVGLVKLMGRHSGFIAAQATLASRNVNLVLAPEFDFDIEGRDGLLAWLEERLERRRHAVIVVAEGAGQEYCAGEGTDESGNLRLGDIGIYLKDVINRHCKERGIELNLKYIDPSYIIRSVRANAEDSVFCGFLGQQAVHAGMAGKTAMIVGSWSSQFVYVPIALVIRGRKQLDLMGATWRSVLEATGQPRLKENQSW
jgi:6-phosphofructokinase 1